MALFPPSVVAAAAALGVDVSSLGQQEVQLLKQILAVSTAIAAGGDGGGGAPSGPAGGDLSGTYPNPLVDSSHGVAFGSGAFAAAGIGGDVSAAPPGSVLVATGSGNNAGATGVTIDGSNNVITTGKYYVGNPAGLYGSFYSTGASGIVIEGNVGVLTLNTTNVRITDLHCSLRQASQGFLGIQDASNGSAITGIQFGLGGVIRNAGTTIEIPVTDGATNTVVNALTLTHATSATAAAGLGVAQVFQLPSDAGTLRVAGSIQAAWGSAADGVEDSILNLYAYAGGPSLQASFNMLTGIGSLFSGQIAFPNLALTGTPPVANNSFPLVIGGTVVQVCCVSP